MTNSILKQLPNETTEFIDSLILAKGMKNLPAEVYEQVFGEIYQRLEKWLLGDMLLKVPDEEADKIEKFMDTEPSPAQITTYLQSVIPDYEVVYYDSLKSFEKTYLE